MKLQLKDEDGEMIEPDLDNTKTLGDYDIGDYCILHVFNSLFTYLLS